MGLRPALALRLAPAEFARFLRIFRGHVDLDAARQKVAAAVDRRDAAVTARDLPLNDPRNEQRDQQAGERKQAPVAAESRSWKTGAKARQCGRNHDVLMPYPEDRKSKRLNYSP